MMGATLIAVLSAALAIAPHAAADVGRARGFDVRLTQTTTPPQAKPGAVKKLGRVSRISVAPAKTAAAVVTIAIDSGVTVHSLVLENPHRLVIDMGGARMNVPERAYDGAARGVIRNLRIAQFRDDTARVVLDLDQARQYTVNQSATQVYVLIEGAPTEFSRWDSKIGVVAEVAKSAPAKTEAATAESQKPDASKTGATGTDAAALAAARAAAAAARDSLATIEAAKAAAARAARADSIRAARAAAAARRDSAARVDAEKLAAARAAATAAAAARADSARKEALRVEAARAARADSVKAAALRAEAARAARADSIKAEALRADALRAARADSVKAARVKADAEAKAKADADRAAKAEAARRDAARADSLKAVKAVADAKAQADAKANADLPLASRGGRSQTAQKQRMSITFDGIDIHEAIAAFAAFSGRTIIPGKEVQGTVTADIRDKPWDVALQALLQAYGLAATEDASGIITVDSYRNLASNQALEPMLTQILEVNYAKASTLAKTVQALLAKDCTGLTTMATGRDLGMPMAGGGTGSQSNNQMGGQGCVVRGSVAADSATNKLIITEVPSRLPEIVARVRELDIRTPQVAIKAKIIFVNRTGIQDIGLAYDLGTGTKQFFQQLVPRTDPSTMTSIDTDGDGVPDAIGGGSPYQGPARIALGGNALAGIANANNAIKSNALNLIYSTALGRFQLTAFLNALQTSSLADVQSEPSVTILNNRNAEIFVGQEIPIRVIDASSGAGAQGGQGGGQGAQGSQPNAQAFFPRATVSKEEAGIKLSVTPQITNNRMVLMNIKAENSSAEVSATDVGVIFNRQRAESQVLVADGEAAVIGGLTVTETTHYRSGIPGLMNIPYIGKLFSQNTKNETKRDLLILVTPHILEDGTLAPSGR